MDRNRRAFSLLSLIVALAISTILISAAGGTLYQRIAIARAQADHTQIEEGLRFARHAALLHGQSIDVCIEDSQGNCGRESGERLIIRFASGGQTLWQINASDSGYFLLQGAFGERRLRLAADGGATLSGSIHYCPKPPSGALSPNLVPQRISLSPGGHVRRRTSSLCPQRSD